MSFGDGDSHPVYCHLSCYETKDAATIGAKEAFTVIVESKRDINPIHISMLEKNSYIFIGNRNDCELGLTHRYFGGFVIEETNVLGLYEQ